mgnify:CR=1 FL=1
MDFRELIAKRRSVREFDGRAVPADLVREIICLLYTSDAADDLLLVDLGGCRIIKKNLYDPRYDKSNYKSAKSHGYTYTHTANVVRQLSPTHIAFNGKTRTPTSRHAPHPIL